VHAIYFILFDGRVALIGAGRGGSEDADILCEGHFEVYRGKQTVADFIASFMG